MMAALSPQRARWKGSEEELAAAMLPFATSKNFVVYDEANEVHDAKVDLKKLAMVIPLAAALKERLGSLAFTRTDIQGALRIVFEIKNSDWQMTERAFPEWQVRTSRKLMNAFHVMSYNEGKTRQPGWVAQLLPWAAASTSVASTKITKKRPAEAVDLEEEKLEQEPKLKEPRPTEPQVEVCKGPAARTTEPAVLEGYDELAERERYLDLRRGRVVHAERGLEDVVALQPT